jgi:sirohydrochlorin cobaltochelatase
MNCRLCKYRTRTIGYEGDAGVQQTARPHHVRGISSDGGHSHHHHR